ncbi:MAG: TRAP transporter small permease subunit [Proteobacteria bacterium]|nr:TRAP transporter small permease subunit [Pseudomonadota bacterium]MBU1584915.1 TRAP transporter small permease subunit [Pseudomonadota bacterium]MBU2456272.1 TRAP transporter small permease subunit [Pseudomonadota bacterium]
MEKNTIEKSLRIANILDRTIIWICHKASWLIAILMIVIIFQVVLRYVLHKSYVSIEEIQWHIYAIVIMLGLSYSFVKDSHIRLDVLHTNFSRPLKEKIEIIGILFFLWPVIFIFLMHSLDFVAESFRVGERSDAPMGLGYRWIIKSIIPIGFSLLYLGSISRLLKAIHYLKFNNRKK